MAPSNDRARLHELRRLAYGELDVEAERALRRRLESNPEASVRLRQLMDEATEFERVEASVDAFSAAVLERLERSDDQPPPRAASAPWGLAHALRPPKIVGWAVAAAAAMSLWLVVAPEAPEPGVRTKGGRESSPPAGEAQCAQTPCPHLEMFVKDHDGIRPGLDGVRLRDGDWVQFRYRASGHSHLFVVSLDDDGVLTPLYPDHFGSSVVIRSEGRHVLSGSIILDDAIGPERIYAFFSGHPLSFEEVERAMDSIVDPEHEARVAGLPRGVDQVSILIHKVSP